jgi:primosomal protein N' (replication factor Y)
MKLLRPGVTKAAADLQRLLDEPVLEVSSQVDNPGTDERTAGVLLGTEAVLHRVQDAGLVAFLDFDQELLSPRYRASEEALALLVRASRLVGGRAGGASSGQILVQTRLPEHEVLRASMAGDPTGVSQPELRRREVLQMPPCSTVAAVGGPAAPKWIELLGEPEGVQVSGGENGWWLLRAGEVASLCDAAALVDRPSGTLRLRVDPVRL